MKSRIQMFIVMFGVAASAASQAETKVGVIDMQKLVQTSEEGKKIKTEIENEFAKKKTDLEKKEKELQAVDKDLEKKKSVMSEEAFAKRREEFQLQIQQFREVVSKNQLDLQKRQNSLLESLLEKMRKATDKVAKAKGLSLVMDKAAGILYVEKDVDITDDVLKSL